MRELLKMDFRRVLKDKLLIVMLILATVFAVMTPLMYAGLEWILGGEDGGMMFGLNFYAKQQFFAAFSIGSDFGLIAPVFLAIVLCKDFFSGTVRNKIIAGKSRASIFASLFTVCATVMVAVMLFYAFVTLGCSLIFFDYQAEPFEAADLAYFFESLAFSILVLIAVSSLLSWLCVAMKNVGLVIVMYVAFSFGTVIVGSIASVAIPLMEASEVNEFIVDLVRFFDRLNIGNAVAYIGVGTEYELKDVLYLTIVPIAETLGLFGLGFLKFKKKDLK
ncbi:MAG: hypothetical protein IKV35_02840 [Clostridia bacterium]|nr:hypothetical protein [Clostridia bacterium]